MARPPAFPAPAELPRSYCVELTSRCPFDCVFCTRKETRGSGQHMDFALFESLMRQVGRPERILLNSLGESMHYPQLPDAIRLAKATGATTELISTLCSAPAGVVRAVLEAGLDQLHVSLHTLDEQRFTQIYRLRSADAMREAVARFLELRRETGASTGLDFSFVAIEQNLQDLEGVACFAERLGVGLVRILALSQPAHRRHLFAAELDGNWLSRPFRARLKQAIESVRLSHPRVEIEEPLLEECGAISAAPRLWPGALPQGASLAGCEESPWETTHVRANGDVVACGDDAMTSLGNLVAEPLHAIWHGDRYRALRRDHVLGRHPVCNECPIKLAHTPSRVAPFVSGDAESAQLLWGWYGLEPIGCRWSRQEAAIALAVSPSGGRVRIRGLLPPAANGDPNRLRVSADGAPLGDVSSHSREMQAFDAVFPLPPGEGEVRQLAFRTDEVFEPRRRNGGSQDARRLGFALVRAEFEPAA
jgi:radical SAM protein with 4Fe4S-binding SPASM domain